MIVETTLPFSDDFLDEYLNNIKNYVFYIDIDNSKIKGKNLLNYIYNSEMICDLKVDYNDNLVELLLKYITSNKIIHIPVLTDIWNKIILCSINKEKIHEETKDFQTFIIKFQENHIEIINELIEILFSLKCKLYNNLGYNAFTGEYKGYSTFNNVGINIIALKESPYFWRIFSDDNFNNIPLYNYTEFDKMIFNGATISYVFFNSFTPFGVYKYLIGKDSCLCKK